MYYTYLHKLNHSHYSGDFPGLLEKFFARATPYE